MNRTFAKKPIPKPAAVSSRINDVENDDDGRPKGRLRSLLKGNILFRSRSHFKISTESKKQQLLLA
jgi:hypothetical protein